MRNLMRMIRRRARALLGAGVLLTAMVGASVPVAGGTAEAAACGSAIPAGTSCALTGTLIITSGTLTLTSPSALGWSGTVNGLNQNLVDPTAAQQSYLVDDATGTAPGWNVTISATQFTTGGGSPSTLADGGTFSTNGSVGSMTATTAPATACLTGSTCTQPTDTTTYPVAITTTTAGTTPVTIYDTAAGTGLGSTTIGGSTSGAPVGWWLSVPSNTLQGTYTSTVTMELLTGP
jgi:hypothetical protein